MSADRFRALRLLTVGLVAASALAAGAAPEAASAAGAGPCPPGVGIGLLEVPRVLLGDSRARSYIIDRVAPGTTFTRQIKICNGLDRAARLAVYPDAAAVQGGSFQLADGAATNELTSWLSVRPPSVLLPAGASTAGEVRIQVPAYATAGERYAAVVVQGPPTRRADGLMVTSRVGLRIYLDVGRGGIAPDDFTIDSLQAARRANGQPEVLARVHNTGPRAVDLSGSLLLGQGPGGLSGGPFPATLGTTLAPGQAEPVTVPLPMAIRGGPWTATLTLASGPLTRRAAGEITFPDEAGRAAAPVRAHSLPLAKEHPVVVLVAGGLLGLLLLLLLVLWRLALRRRRAAGG